MIRITAEIIPEGNESEKQFLGVCEIWNVKTGTSDSGNYRFRISKEDSNINLTIGEIKGFQRLTRSIWHLAYEVFKEAFTKKPKRR